MSIVGCWCLPHHLIFFSFKSKERIKWNKHNVCPTEEQEEAKEGKMLSLLRREDERNNWEELSTTTRFQQKLDEQLKLQYEVYQEKKVRFDMKSAFNECIEWFALFWSPILMEINSHPKQDKNQGKSNQSLTGLISFNHLSKWNKNSVVLLYFSHYSSRLLSFSVIQINVVMIILMTKRETNFSNKHLFLLHEENIWVNNFPDSFFCETKTQRF